MDKKELTSREKRRRRRIRSQIAAYLTLVIVVGALTTGAVIGIKALIQHMNQYNDKVAEALQEAETNVEHETAVIESSTAEDVTQEAEPEDNPLDELVDALLQDRHWKRRLPVCSWSLLSLLPVSVRQFRQAKVRRMH